jgi:hypothetical protein
VTWRNGDDIPHTVTSATRLFKSKALDTDDSFSFSFTFTEPGTYEYFCSLHPRMTGTIVVEAGLGREINLMHSALRRQSQSGNCSRHTRHRGYVRGRRRRLVVSRTRGDTSDVFRIIHVETHDVVKEFPRSSWAILMSSKPF